MEKKLAEYRARKQKEALEQHKLNPLENEPKIFTNNNEQVFLEQPSISKESEKIILPLPATGTSARKLELSITALKVILWCLLMALFVVLEFGAVFFVFSVFYFMYSNFRTTPKKPGEVSAYSVFNPNCEAIDGTINAEQFEAELKYGAISVH